MVVRGIQGYERTHCKIHYSSRAFLALLKDKVLGKLLIKCLLDQFR